MYLRVMFGLFVLLILRAPSAQIYTEWWGIFDLQPPDGVCLIILSSLFLYCYGDTDVGLDKMHTPDGVENIRPVTENVLLSLWSTPMVSKCMIFTTQVLRRLSFSISFLFGMPTSEMK